ncbi:MAG: Pr6Pr family membrane protein [Opitutaceae bacterium]
MSAWFGVLLQLYLSLRTGFEPGKSVVYGFVMYLGYFTVLTNLFVAIGLTWSRLLPASSGGHFFGRPDVLATMTASIFMVGLAYHFLLRHVWNPQGLNWVADFVLHYATPLSCCAYWWINAPKQTLSWVGPLGWSLYPLAYLAYALIRGELLEVYPYHFIDVGQLGWAKTLRNSAGLLIVFLVIGLGMVVLAKLQTRRRSPAAPPE